MKCLLRRVCPLALLLSAHSALAKDLPNFDASWAAARPQRRETPAIQPAASVASLDARRGAPSFVWAARRPPRVASAAGVALTPGAAARAHLSEHAALYGLSNEAIQTASVARVHDAGRGGIVVVFRQEVGGVEVFHSDAKVLMTRGLDLVAIGGGLDAGAVAHPKGATFALSMPAAVALAFRDLYGVEVLAGDLVGVQKEQANYRFFALSPSGAAKSAGLSLLVPVRAKKVLFPMPDRLVAAYFLEILASDRGAKSSDAYAYVLAADDGRLLYRQNLTHADSFQYRVWAGASGDKRPADGPLLDFAPHPTGAPDGSYPDFATPSLVTMEGFNSNPNQKADPWLAAAATETSGNNVDAYTDDDSPDGFSSGDLRASVTSPGVFDRTYDVHAGPQTSSDQEMAAVTQLFYVTNWLHDWWYDSGFDEKAGNAQKDNYGRGGIDGDAMHAEGQDGAPDKRNNADMSVPADGESPRMQVYVWDGPNTSTLGVQPLNQNLPSGVAEFGPPAFDVTGTVVLVDDGAGKTTDACEPIVNSVSGQIALVDRGSCTFKQKAVNAETAGAIGIIIVDNVANQAPPPLFDGNPSGPVSIPAQSIKLVDGDAIKAALANGAVTATMSRVLSPDRDGTIDNTTVAHEWGHYLHLRQVACGMPICSAESEGWADFTALQMVLRDGDDLDSAYPISQYATAGFPDDPGYFGIRRYPYSVDFTKNPLTFKHIQDGEPLPASVPLAGSNDAFGNAEDHAAGEVWAAMLFEGFVALLKQSQGQSPPYSFDEARRRMSDYVEVGLTLAPTDPTYLEQRDAILAAALAADPNDFLVLAEAFARRGAGSCAVAPPKDSFDYVGVVESFELRPNPRVLGVSLDDSVTSCDGDGFLDKAETGQATVRIMNAGSKPLAGAKLTIATTTPGVMFPKGTDLDLPPIDAYATAVASFEVALDASILPMQNVQLGVTVSSPDGCEATASLDAIARLDFDEIAGASSTDDVEASTSAWAIDGPEAASIWSISEAMPGEHAWRAVDHASPSDTALTSPELDVSATDDLVVTFRHRYQFETADGTYWDGGVIETSTDGGKSWSDVSAVTDPGYGGTIGDPTGQAKNVLSGRDGYVDHNMSWPAQNETSLSFGKAFAGQKLRLRFRVGTDDAVGEFGWELDDIEFQGIDNKPFAALVPDASTCGPAGPDADAGPDVSVHGGDIVTLDGSNSSDPSGLTLSFVWKQTQGPEATLSGGDGAKASFVAPEVTVATKLTFQLTVKDAGGSASDTVDVLVEPKAAGAAPRAIGGPYLSGGGCGCGVDGSGGSPALAGSAALLLLAAARRRRRPTA